MTTQTKEPFINKVALITGSGRGIGRSIAHELAQQGADIIINYVRNQEPAEEIAKLIRDLGRKAIVVRANLAKIEDISRLFSQIESEFGKLDIFISNAASGFNHPGMEQKTSGWDWTMNVNARAFLFATQKAVPLMEKCKNGKIISISSPGSHRVLPDYIAVGASKAALEALTRYLAVELAPKNISVNCVSSGLVETDALRHFSTMSKDNVIERTIKNTPAGRLVQPEDIAKIVSFLCTTEADMIRGQVITVDGGFTLLVRE